MAQSEKLSIWDRLFNRYRKEIHGRGNEAWYRHREGIRIPNSEFTRNWIEYKIIDRLTGSEEIRREYLDDED